MLKIICRLQTSLSCSVWDAHMGSVVPMTTTARTLLLQLVLDSEAGRLTLPVPHCRSQQSLLNELPALSNGHQRCSHACHVTFSSEHIKMLYSWLYVN